MLRATPEGEALLAGVDECVTHGWQVQGPDIGVCGRLWLFAVVGWVIRAKTTLSLRSPGFEDAADTFEGPLIHPLSLCRTLFLSISTLSCLAPSPSPLCEFTFKVFRNILA